MNLSPTHKESQPKVSKANTPFFSPVVQKKMSIGAVNDVYENEADAIADRIMLMSDSGAHNFSHTGALVQRKCTHCEEEENIQKKDLSESITPIIQKSSIQSSSEAETSSHIENKINTGSLVQRKCTHCEEEEKIQKKELGERITPIIQKSSLQSSLEAEAPSHIENQINTTRGGGRNMDEETSDFMENRFGVDFSNVRIHTSGQATQMSQELNAQAFTVGNDIYFNEGKYNPNSNSGKHLLAHELTHTVQQSGSNVKKLQKKATNGTLIQRGVLSTIGGGIADAASTTWDYTGGAAIRAGGRAIEWVEDRAEEIINEIAPGLLDFLRSSIWEPIRDMIATGLDTMTGGLFTRLQEEGLSGILHEFVDSVMLTLQGAIADACRSFAQLADKIFNFISSLSSGALARLRSTFNTVSGFFSSIWSDYGKPAMDAIKFYARAAWDWVEEKVKWVWDLIEPIRNGIERAWNWIKDLFNIAWEGASSVWDWLVEKATEAWDWIKEAIEPIKTPLMVIGGILILLSPLGLFAAIGAATYGIYIAVQWVRANWNNEVFVRFRNYLQENILAPIQQGIEQLRALVNIALQWLSGLFQELQAAFESLLNAVMQSTLFTFLRGIVQTVSNVIQTVTTWIVVQSTRIGQFIAEVVQSVWAFIRPVAIVVAKLIILANYPFLIPVVLMAWYWRMLPDCFKPPIINFVLRVMIGVLRAMPNFAMFGDTWVEVKTRIIQFLQQTLSKSDEEKITVANRVAKMISEMDLSLLSNQIAAAAGAPAEFEGQIEEELLGVNLTTALPFELSEARIASLHTQFQSSGLVDSVDPNDAALFNRTEYSNQHIGVDSVGSFAPDADLQQAILNRTGTEDGTAEFGNSEDSSRSVHGILSEMIPAGGEGEATGMADPNGTEGGVTTHPPMSHEEETEMRLQQMMAQSNEEMARQACAPPANDGAAAPEAAASAFPEEAKFGPLTRGQRGRYTMNQMSSGIGHWWRCNRNWLIPAIIGVIVVIVLAEILTGGAVTAALPAIFGALAPIMIGVAALRAAYYLGEYVYKSISGDIAGASRALARGFAVAAVEAIFALLGSSAFWKSLKGGISSAGRAVGRVGSSLVRGAGRVIAGTGRLGAGLVRTVGAGSRYVLRTAGAVITRGRLILQGVRGRIGQGVRSLEELAERLFTRVRFRRFRMRFTRGWFRLEGFINPWVLLATGELQFIEQNRLRPSGGGGLLDDTVRLGDEVLIGSGNSRGIIVGVERNPSRFVSELDDLSRSSRMAEFRDLRGSAGSRLSAADRLRIIQNGETTAALRRGIPGPQPLNFQAHHIVPRELRRPFEDFFRAIGFDIENGVRNGIMIPPDATTLSIAITANPSIASRFSTSALHLGSHPDYTARMVTELTGIRSALDSNLITQAQALAQVDDVINRARTAIMNGGGIHINDVNF
jgi:Domain of unknown function (DUF4157)/A nuclease family of the HNH/ENDO VII superfamily with conserved AHH